MTAVIEKCADAQVLTTSLNLLRKAGACKDRYKHLVKALGGRNFAHDAPINLLTILAHNGVEDCLWALCATAEDCDKVARFMAADFAEAVLPIFERERPGDDRPRKSIAAARALARGEIGAAASDAARTAAARDAAGTAAWDAAWDAARTAARDAARTAAWAAARAAWDAAWAGAKTAAWAAPRTAAWDAQKQIVLKYLLEGK